MPSNAKWSKIEVIILKMVRQDILGGLKAALSRGESINQAMTSFHNAGYKKEDIESAARALQIQQQAQPIKQITETPKQKLVKTTKKQIQRVSNYEQNPKKFKGKLITFLLVFILLFLLGVLAAVFFFKEELVEFFNNLFG